MNILDVKIDDNNIKLNILDNRYIGIFVYDDNCSNNNIFNDDYIIDMLVEIYDVMPYQEGLFHMFNIIESDIKLRNAWKKLYFRCFRKSFSPLRRNGIINISMSEDIMSNMLNYKYSI